jgi:hypothetical protein
LLSAANYLQNAGYFFVTAVVKRESKLFRYSFSSAV